MNLSWTPDAVLVLLLLITGGLAILFHTSRIKQNPAPPTLSHTASRRRFSPYPGKLIRQCGLSADNSKWLYWALKCACVVILIVLLTEISAPPLPIWSFVIIGLSAFFLVDLSLLWRRHRRRQQIEHALSFFITLIITYLRAGSTLSNAFRLAAQYGLNSKEPLAQEVTLLAHEIDAGRGRQRAFGALADRTGVRALQRLAEILATSISIGNPMIDTLQSQADLLVAHHRQQTTARINRKVMAAMLPILLTCFPLFVAFVVYPAGKQILDLLRFLGDLM